MGVTPGHFEAQIHTVEPVYGQHHRFYMQCLGEMSLWSLPKQAYIYDRTTQTKYTGLDDIPDLAWIELGDTRGLPYRQQAARTFLVTGTGADTPLHYRFSPATELLRTEMLSDHLKGWLRPFLATDRPNPPLQANRTDVIRDIATLLPPLDPAAYARNAVANMPSLRAYYAAHGVILD